MPHAHAQEHTNRDPDLTVLWTTREWAAWPRGLSKAAARVMCDPLVFFTAFVPVLVLGFNVAWPHRVTHQSLTSRVMYILRRLVLVPSAVAAIFFITGTTRTHLLVSWQGPWTLCAACAVLQCYVLAFGRSVSRPRPQDVEPGTSEPHMGLLAAHQSQLRCRCANAMQ